jgi:dihydroxyacetone kinase-like predicted kinase
MREIDGRWLYYMFLAGTRKVVANQERLNRINVFPVKDGDTGANMAFTLSAVVESVKPERTYKRMLDRIAETALLNARGNSGIIYSTSIRLCHWMPTGIRWCLAKPSARRPT